MKVSVIVPVYNVEEYLSKCLDSLVNQTLSDIEIIVVNDGSPDNSKRIIDTYSKEYDNIRAFDKENGGLSDARNFGLMKAKGEYVAFIDSDDYIKSNMLEKMYNKAKEIDADIVLCDTINVYEDGSEVLVKSNLNYTQDMIKSYLIAPPMACIRLYRKSLFDKISFKKGIYYEDLELTPKLVNMAKKIGFVNEGLYYYLQRTGSIMKQKSFNDKLLDIFTVLDGNKELLINDYKDEVEYMYITHLLRTATLRFLDYSNTRHYLVRIVNIMKSDFPKWKNNIYFKKSSNKTKIICYLAYYKCYGLLKLIKKLTNK